MTTKKLHFLSGIIISVFVGLHLFNHLYSLLGAAAHIELMDDLRVFYRNSIAETILLLAVLIQIISGIKLFIKKRKTVHSFFDKLQIRTGLYLAFFFIIHLSAIFTGRWLLDLDTNFYFGVTDCAAGTIFLSVFLLFYNQQKLHASSLLHLPPHPVLPPHRTLGDYFSGHRPPGKRR